MKPKNNGTGLIGRYRRARRKYRRGNYDASLDEFLEREEGLKVKRVEKPLSDPTSLWDLIKSLFSSKEKNQLG